MAHRKKTSKHLIITIFSSLISIQNTETVLEDHKTYNCSRNVSTLEFTPHQNCRQSWTEGDKAIAYYEGRHEECSDPCIKISSGNITLSKCPNVTLTVECPNENGILQETWTHFKAVKDNIHHEQHSAESHLNSARSRYFYIYLGVWVVLCCVLLVVCRCRPEEDKLECGV